MIKWVVDWSEARTFRDSINANNGILWAIEMPEDYPECRVTRRGIANIAITDEEGFMSELKEDGGEPKLLK
jgi:hypothetical protein